MIGREHWCFGTHPSRRTPAACPVGGARTWPALAGLLATILASWVDFVPGAGLVIASAVLAALSAWMIHGRRIEQGEQKRPLAMVDYAGLCLLFAGIWSTLAVLLPALPTLLAGPMTVERRVVLSRNAPWQQGFCRALRIDNLGWPASRAFCVGQAVWQASEPGQMMAVRVSRSPMGTYVHEMEPVCGGFVDQRLASPAPDALFSLPK